MTTELEQGRNWDRKYPILLALAGLCAYWNSFGGTYFLDDHVWIVTNPRIGDLFSFFLGNRVLIAASLTLNYWLDGVNPRGYHVVNLAIHILACLTLYGVVRRTLLLPRWSERLRGRASLLAFVIALLWLIHPLHTQAVTYIIQRCECMAGLFYLLTLYCVLRGAAAARNWGWYAAAGLACVGGVLCKEVMLTAPLVILIYDYVFLSPSLARLVRQRWGLYCALAVPPLAYVCWIAGTGLLTAKDTAVSFNYQGFGPVQYALTQPGVILYYLRLSIWPAPLCMDYLDWPIAHSLADCWLSASVIGFLLIAVVLGVARRSWLGFAGAWFILILAPSSSIMPIQDPVFEYRMYLSLAAVVAVGVAVFYILLDRAVARGATSPKVIARFATALVCVWCVFLASLTMMRNAKYCNFIVMAHDIVVQRPGNYRARETFAQVEMAQGQVEDALEDLRQVVRVKPNYYLAFNTAGLCFLRQGRLEEAVQMFQSAVDLQPGFQPDVYPANLGRALILQGDAARAIEHLDDAIRRSPTKARYRVLRAVALQMDKRDDEARAEFEQAVRLDNSLPRTLNAEVRLCVLDPKANAVLIREAVYMAEAVCRMTYDLEPEYLDTLGEAYAAVGRFDDAQEVCRKAADLAAEAGQADLAQQMSNRLELYRKHRSYTQESAS